MPRFVVLIPVSVASPKAAPATATLPCEIFWREMLGVPLAYPTNERRIESCSPGEAT